MIPAPLDTWEARHAFHKLVLACYDEMNPPVRRHAACLYWGMATLMAAERFGLREHGWDLMLQGGTAGWQRIRPEEDDGVVHDMFSYVFELSDMTRQKVRNNELPEMHVWCACPKKQVLMDFTTGFAPQQCRETGGMPWTNHEPNHYEIIAAEDGFPPGMFYAPHPLAVMLAHKFAERVGTVLAPPRAALRCS